MNEIFDYCAVNATIVDRTKMAIFEDEVNMPLLVSNSLSVVALAVALALAVRTLGLALAVRSDSISINISISVSISISNIISRAQHNH